MSKKSIDELLGEFSSDRSVAAQAQAARDKVEIDKKAAIAAKTKTPAQIDAMIDKIFSIGGPELLSLQKKMQKMDGFQPSGANYWSSRNSDTAEQEHDVTARGAKVRTLYKVRFSTTSAAGVHRTAEIKLSYQAPDSHFDFGSICIGSKVDTTSEFKVFASARMDSDVITAAWCSEAIKTALADVRG